MENFSVNGSLLYDVNVCCSMLIYVLRKIHSYNLYYIVYYYYIFYSMFGFRITIYTSICLLVYKKKHFFIVTIYTLIKNRDLWEKNTVSHKHKKYISFNFYK